MTAKRIFVKEFIELCEKGERITAFERYFADDVLLFENHELAAAGRQAAIERERRQSLRLATGPTMRSKGHAVSEGSGYAYLEWEVRFSTPTGEHFRLHEIVRQDWSEGHIQRVQHVYAGLVDESDEDLEVRP